MTCFIAKNMLSEYVDEALDPARLRELEEHLATCASCARELAEIRRIRQSLRVLPVENAPADFYAKVMAKAERKTVLERVSGALSVVWKLPAPAKAGVAFAASVVVVATVWVNNEHRDLWSLGAAPGRQLEQTAARAPSVADAEVPPPPPSGGTDSADALAAGEDERPKAAPADDGHEYKDGKLVATGAFAAATATPAARANPALEAQGGIGVAPSLDANAGPAAGAKQNRRAGATTTAVAALAEKKAPPPAATPMPMPKNEVANGETSTMRKAAAAPEKVARMRDASATDLPTSAMAATPPSKPGLYVSQPAGAGRGGGDGFVAGGDLDGAGNGGGGAGAAGGSGSTAMHAHATSSGPAAAETREHAPLQPRTTVAAKSARAPARGDAAKPDGANAAAPAPASAPQMEFSGGEASPEPAFGSGAALDDAASSDTGETETTRDRTKSASGKGKRAEAAREAPSESEESLSTESLARASKEQDKDVQEEAAKAPNGSASAPFPARFTTSLANGPALVVDAVRAIGGRAITTNPPALAKSGVSTVVLVEIPPSKWDAFAEKLHDAGDLSLQSDPPTARARIRIEVIRH